MKNMLLGRGILLPTGEISKDKINLVAGAVTEPFAEMVWATTGGDRETINRLHPEATQYFLFSFAAFTSAPKASKPGQS